MSERQRTWVVVLVLAVIAGVTLAMISSNRQPAGVNPVGQGNGTPRNDLGSDQRGRFEQREVDPNSFEAIVGTTQPVPFDANPMVASVAEAMKKGGHSERLSSMIIPARFDPQSYAADPQKYLNTVEPGRVWQSAQPGPGVTRAGLASKAFSEVLQGEAVPLKVKVLPNAPVTFTSIDLGAFSNRLTSITVAADQDGIATAQFIGTPGTYNDVNILAASPVTSGQVKFVVTVVVPKLRELQAQASAK